MSRRTKVTLLVLFALVSGLAIGYSLLAPQPENPLRLRLASVQAAPSAKSAAIYRTYDVTIENTTNVPIQLYRAILIPENGPRAGEDGDDSGVMLNVNGSTSSIYVPARGHIQGSLIVDTPSIASAESGKMHINYFWRPNVWHAIEEWYRNLTLYLPRGLRPSTNTAFFEISRHSAPLDPLRP